MTAMLVCHRPSAEIINHFTWWPDVAAARVKHNQAPCSQHCVRVHTIVWLDRRTGRYHCEAHGVDQSRTASRSNIFHLQALRRDHVFPGEPTQPAHL